MKHTRQASGWSRASTRWSVIIALALLCIGAVSRAAAPLAFGVPSGRIPPADTVDWKAVDAAMGRTGAMQPGAVYKYAIPRNDLTVRVGAVTLKPALALGGWVAFKEYGATAMVMGDLVLLEAEIAPVMQALQSAGIQQTALHNHLLNETPHVMYMHIEAHGDPVLLARGIRAAIALTGAPTPPAMSATAPSITLDTAKVAQHLGYHGKANGGVYQVSVPRQEVVVVDGMEVPPAMGVATAINFQPTTGNSAVITGDFVLTATEVNPVIKALRAHGITVTALHNHMLGEEPRLLFMHFWGNDDAAKLADGLRAALDLTKVKVP